MKETVIIIQHLSVFFSLTVVKDFVNDSEYNRFNLHEPENICIEKLAKYEKMVDPQIARLCKALKNSNMGLTLVSPSKYTLWQHLFCCAYQARRVW